MTCNHPKIQFASTWASIALLVSLLTGCGSAPLQLKLPIDSDASVASVNPPAPTGAPSAVEPVARATPIGPAPTAAPARTAETARTIPRPSGSTLARVAPEPARLTTESAIRSVPSTPIEASREIRDTLPISQTIDLTTPADDLWERIRKGFGMPNLSSPLVLDRQIWYASRPGDLRRMAERSRRYLYHIVEELEKRGMPTELALLPMVESAFNPMAYSSAHASGLWQFIPSTGKTYNLRQNWWYDARRDVIASTSAALDYLQFLYDMHGDWHLALASYNWGENAVARAIERNRARGLPTDYLSLTMPQETRYYVPKLQAIKNIVANPEAFRIDLNHIPNQPYFVTVAKTKDIDIQLAAKLAEMSVEELIALNPAHNRPVISASQGETLVLPADHAEIFLANLESHDKPLVSWQAYTFKKGDHLEKIAAERGIQLIKLKQVNGITSRTKVGPGFQLLLPVRGLGSGAEPLPAVFRPPAVPERASSTVTRRATHVVARGETLAGIAKRYGVSVENLRSWNGAGQVNAGQRLFVQRSLPATASSQSTSTARKSSKAKAPAKTKRPAAKPAVKANTKASTARTSG